MTAQTFIRWSRFGVWERLLELAQARGVALGVAFLDGTSVRAHTSGSPKLPRLQLRHAVQLRLDHES